MELPSPISSPTKQTKIQQQFYHYQKHINQYSQATSKEGQKHSIKFEDDIDLSVSKQILFEKKETLKKEEQTNVAFYQNKITSYPNGDFIDKIHKNWYSDYNLLESHHGFIQWIFPNAFHSPFDSSLKPLSPEEAQIFRTDSKIAERYVRSYQMMLVFYGIRIRNKTDGSLERSIVPDFRQRFEKTLKTSFHNHMRITRILSSLVMCGFGRYAQKLSLFLGQQIKGEKGQLRCLERIGVYEREWKQYSEYYVISDEESVYFQRKE